ncbi:MAG: Rossmann-like and DUF2520 domain-containing protein [Gemmatimonadota bacterium]
MPATDTLIIGAGRMGRGIGLALSQAGGRSRLFSRSQDRVVAPVAAEAAGGLGAAVGTADLVVLAVPDDAIANVARELAETGGVRPGQTILHLSGLLDRSVLSALSGSGAALGSFHPLQTIADPTSAPALLRGAVAGIEGDARALASAIELARRLGMRPIVIRADGKAAYHAGAAMVANYTVALAGVAQRLAEQAGVDPVEAGQIYLPLLEGALGNLRKLGAVHGLTGPIRRGDVETVRAHLAVLDATTARLYRSAGLEALQLARAAGLDPSKADAMATELGEPSGGSGEE